MAKRGSGNGGAGNSRAGRNGGGAKLNLAGMQGSEKQVQWASDILQGYVSTFDNAAEAIKSDIRYGENKEYTDLAKKAIKQLKVQKGKEVDAFNAGVKGQGLKASTVIDRRRNFSAKTSTIEENALRAAGVKDYIKISSFTAHIRKPNK